MLGLSKASSSLTFLSVVRQSTKIELCKIEPFQSRAFQLCCERRLTPSACLSALPALDATTTRLEQRAKLCRCQHLEDPELLFARELHRLAVWIPRNVGGAARRRFHESNLRELPTPVIASEARGLGPKCIRFGDRFSTCRCSFGWSEMGSRGMVCVRP